MINHDLARSRGLTKKQVARLEVEHMAMDAMVSAHRNAYMLPKRRQKALRRHVRNAEYRMQVIWGFDRDRHLHSHWRRFQWEKPYPAWTAITAEDLLGIEPGKARTVHHDD